MEDKGFKNLGKFIKSIKKVRAFSVEEGTVVKWKSGVYNYAAIYAGGKWWITGTGRWYGGNVFDTAEFMDVLAAASSVEVATTWTEVE